MINFRYHVVSLTAVFLALAVGLVLGSTVLNGPMLDALNNQVNTLGRDNSQLREQVSFLEEEASREETFAAEAAPMLLSDTLTGRRVALVVLPGAEDYGEGVAEMLRLAGASITATLQVTDKFTHPAHRLDELLDLAHRVVPPSVDAERLPAFDGVEASAALWAAVLLDGAPVPAPADDEQEQVAEEEAAEPEGPVVKTVPDQERREVLSSYVATEFLTMPDGPSGPAEILVVVTGLPVTDADADERNQAMLTVVEQLHLAGPLVVAAAGPSGSGNLVVEIRRDPALSASISTVDNAATPQGQVAAALAVARHLAAGPGHYGTGSGAERLLPVKSTE